MQIFPLYVETLFELSFDSYTYYLSCCEFISRSVQLGQKQVFVVVGGYFFCFCLFVLWSYTSPGPLNLFFPSLALIAEP